MAREAEIVVAAEVDEALAVDHHFCAIAFNGKVLNGVAPTPQMLAIDFRQSGLQSRWALASRGVDDFRFRWGHARWRMTMRCDPLRLVMP